MRGKVDVFRRVSENPRITPAYAGKSKREPYSFRFNWDHPRLCGEKRTRYFGMCQRLGSPPPMRGKAQNGSKRRRVHRITPAYAGKSSVATTAAFSYGDHPRLCGEKVKHRATACGSAGSPPPMRGKVSVNRVHSAATRITPAYAGKSFHFPFKRTAVRDHPRLCGEKFWTLADSVKL